MSPPRKPGIPASVATTAMVSNAPDGSTIGHFTVVYDVAHLEKRVHVHEYSVVNPGAVLGKGAHVGPHCVIDQDAIIGSNAHLGSHCSTSCRLRLTRPERTPCLPYPSKGGVRMRADRAAAAEPGSIAPHPAPVVGAH